MVQVTYPGVYIQEVPSAVHTITSVATSITAFIDFFKEGPMNEAVEIYGMTDFQRVFGGLDTRSEASYAISQFFLNGGANALVIRVAAATTAKRAGVIVREEKGGTEILDITAANEGIWGNNLRVDIDYNTIDPVTQEIGTLFNVTATRYDGVGAKAKPVATESFINLTMDERKPRYAVRIINDGSSLIHVNKGGSAGATTRPASTGTISGHLTLSQSALDTLGSTAKKIKVTIGSLPTADVSLPAWSKGEVTNLKQLAARIQQAIRTVSDTPPASFAGTVVEAIGDRLRIRSGSSADSWEPTEIVVIADDGDTTASATLKLTDANLANVQQYKLGLAAGGDIGALMRSTEGFDGNKPGAADIIGSRGVEPHTGIYALDYTDLFNILCIPCAAKLDDDTQVVAVVSDALKYCGDRRAFMIIDLPDKQNDTQKVKDWLDAHGSFRNKNAALYFPRPQNPRPDERVQPALGRRQRHDGGDLRPDRLRTRRLEGAGRDRGGAARSERVRLCSRSGGHAEGAKAQRRRERHAQPACHQLSAHVPDLRRVAWGARTLVGADQIGSEWKYIPVRRLALMLEESLFRGTKWVVFEPNDEPLWANIRLNVGAYMMSLFRQGAFQGTNPKDAFFVKCDAETTTQDDRNKGIVNILVGFAPLKPAEFVVISIQQIAGDL